MSNENSFVVTAGDHGDPHDDIGAVINSILADVTQRQERADVRDGGRPGVVIRIPPGDYRLRTQVRIGISFVRIEGSGHGFTSSSIRFNVPADEWDSLHELWPGGSRILVDLPAADGGDPAASAAFLIARDGDPRISSVEFSGFCIDGLHFTGTAADGNPENSYVNGKTGIYAATANDSVRINGMGFVYLENALVMCNADALSIHDNFVAECGSCIELRGWGQASKITDNLIGAGPAGHSIYAENHGGLLIAANNVFPRGQSSVHLHGVTRSTVTANRLHSFYPGMVRLTGGSSENLVSANHLLRDHEPWTPFFGVDNGVADDFGLLHVSGSDNSIIGNHVSAAIDAEAVTPAGARPVIIRIAEGAGNFVSNTHTVATHVSATANDSCYEAQVGALLQTAADRLPVIAVQVDPVSTGNTVLDSGTDSEVAVDRTANAFRPTPSIG
ncbi:MAG: right-handed parallel beta-helix repeat-containing protein, partial [Microbacterium sp.]